MKVYSLVVEGMDYDESDSFLGVFPTLEAAMARLPNAKWSAPAMLPSAVYANAKRSWWESKGGVIVEWDMKPERTLAQMDATLNRDFSMALFEADEAEADR